MSASRKGLRRHGMRDYAVDGKRGTIIIHKEKPRDWRIRPAEMHSSFYFERHTLLRDARKAAESLVRGKRDWDAALDLPVCMDRRK